MRIPLPVSLIAAWLASALAETRQSYYSLLSVYLHADSLMSRHKRLCLPPSEDDKVSTISTEERMQCTRASAESSIHWQTTML